MARFIDVSQEYDVQIGLPFDPSSTGDVGIVIAEILDKSIQISLRKDEIIGDYCVMVYNQSIDYKNRIIYVYHSSDVVYALVGMLCYILGEETEKIRWAIHTGG